MIEKAFQSGHKRLEDAGIDVYSLARIASMSADRIEFVELSFPTPSAADFGLPRFVLPKNLKGLPFIFLRNLLKRRISGASGTRI